MVYVEVMLGKRVNWNTMMAYSCSHTRETIDIPSEVDWNGGLMHHAIVNGLLQQGYTLPATTPQSMCMRTNTWNTQWGRHDMGGYDQYKG
jgi:hypothetical protein